MGKHYLNINVYDATEKRLEYLFNEFEHIHVAFSGGKDSGILLNLAYDYAEKHNQLDKLSMHFVDYEAQYQATIDYVDSVFKSLDIEKYWLCMPNSVPTATSMRESFWIPWDKSKQDIWVRDMPKYDYVVNVDNAPFDYEFGTNDYEFQDDFNEWVADKNDGKTAILIGIRADESLDRYRAIASNNKINSYQDKNYVTKKNDFYMAYPIYDWTVDDIWTANAKLGFEYNSIYDLYFYAGIPINKMRVASPFLSQGMDTLKYYQVIEPNTWAKMLGRVNGVNFASIYGSTTAMGWNKIKLPKGMTWKSYVKFLLKTLPEQTRKDYEKIFATSFEFWAKRGGVLSKETIQELNDAGIPFEVKGQTNYKTDKSAVTFEDYPDDAPVREFKTVPSYKRMAITIMKNDHTAKYMGFSRTKEQQERRKKAIAKYKEIF